MAVDQIARMIALDAAQQGGGGGGGGTSDYTDLTNKPKINNVTLAGNKSLNDLGIVEATALTNSQVDAIMNS